MYNVDQVPLPFASDNPITLDHKGTANCWIRQIGSGLDKRQVTLQLCIRPLGVQPIPTLVFRGASEPSDAHWVKVRNEELDHFRTQAKDGKYTCVHALYQAKAWVNGWVNDTWTFDHFLPDVRAMHPQDTKVLLFVDNLACQASETYGQFLEQEGVLRVEARVRRGRRISGSLWTTILARTITGRCVKCTMSGCAVGHTGPT